MRYFGLDGGNVTVAQFKALAKPYLYGHVTEIKVGAGAHGVGGGDRGPFTLC